MSAVVRAEGTSGCRPAAGRRWLRVGAAALVLAAVGGVLWLAGRVRTGPGPAPDGEAARGPAWFEDLTAKAGLDFVHDPGPTGSYFLPQVMGSGAALFDFDGDGRLDVLLLQGAGPDSPSRNRLYHNVGRPGEPRFEDVSAGSGLDFAGYCTGVAVGDVNNDGRPDVLITLYGGMRLFLNRGGGKFTDVSRQAGLETCRWATSAAFFDYDRDGWLDLVVVHYVDFDASRRCHYPQGGRDFCHPRFFKGCATRLYHNVSAGDAVRFEDVTDRSGFGAHPGPGLGVVCADFDGDGWPDVFVANDAAPNHLWLNRRDGTFVETAEERGLARDCLGRTPGNMGIAVGDVDGDGLLDVFVTHLTEETHTLWLQGPRGYFGDVTGPSGVAPPHARGTGFGTALADFDHDGALDLAVANGRVARSRLLGEATAGPFWEPYQENNQLLANDGKGRFRDVSADNPALCRVPGVYRGLAVGDVDGDGAPDLLVTAVGGPARLFRNVAPNRGHWLIVRALDPARGRDAYGAEIVLEAGGRKQLRWLNPGSSYQCSNDPRAHFGLGATDRYGAVTVRWPDRSLDVERFEGGVADREITLLRGKGRRVGR
jgi:hypothetical protein